MLCCIIYVLIADLICRWLHQKISADNFWHMERGVYTLVINSLHPPSPPPEPLDIWSLYLSDHISTYKFSLPIAFVSTGNQWSISWKPLMQFQQKILLPLCRSLFLLLWPWHPTEMVNLSLQLFVSLESDRDFVSLNSPCVCLLISLQNRSSLPPIIRCSQQQVPFQINPLSTTKYTARLSCCYFLGF